MSVDGWNLYYGKLKDQPGRRWLDLDALSRKLLSGYGIHRIRYFTALVNSTPADQQKRSRQELYMRALRSLPNLSVHYGIFLSQRKWMKLDPPPTSGTKRVCVRREEEKMTDVALGTNLLMDAIDRDFDLAVIITNDTDFIPPIRVVRDRFKLKVGIYNPQQRQSGHLPREVDFYRTLRDGPIIGSQFPDMIRDGAGSFTKPANW